LTGTPENDTVPSRVNNSNINSSSGNEILTPAITALSTADGKVHWEYSLCVR